MCVCVCVVWVLCISSLCKQFFCGYEFKLGLSFAWMLFVFEFGLSWLGGWNCFSVVWFGRVGGCKHGSVGILIYGFGLIWVAVSMAL